MKPTVAILGGEGRLGRVLAEYLALHGFEVVSLDIVGHNSRSDLVRFVKCDLSNPEALLESTQLALTLTGEVNYCITALRYRGAGASQYDSMAAEFIVEVAGPHAWIEAVRAAQLPQLLRSVVHISSVLATSTSMQEPAAYHCAKGALESLVRWEALSWGKSGTSVNAIAPGYIDYQKFPDIRERHSSGPLPLLSDTIDMTHALQKPPSPQAICELTKFVLGSNGLTGQVIRIDSGSSILEPLGVALRGMRSSV